MKKNHILMINLKKKYHHLVKKKIQLKMIQMLLIQIKKLKRKKQKIFLQ